MDPELLLGRLAVHIVANTTRYYAPMNGVSQHFQDFVGVMENYGRRLTMAISLPIAGIAGASLRAFSNFEKEMTRSMAVMEGVTDMRRRQLEQQALAISGRSLSAPRELAAAYRELAVAGVDAAHAGAALADVEQFAVANHIRVVDAARLVERAQASLGYNYEGEAGLGRMRELLDAVTVASNRVAGVSAEQMVSALGGHVGPTVQRLGLDLREVTSLLMIFAEQGVRGDTGSNRLAMMVRQLETASTRHAAAWRQANLQVFDAQGNFRSLLSIISDLEHRMHGLSDQQRRTFLMRLGIGMASGGGGVRDPFGMAIGHSKEMRANMEMFGKDLAKTLADANINTFAGQMKNLWNQITIVGEKIGEILVPWIRVLIDYVKVAINWFDSLNDAQKKIVVAIAANLALTGPMLLLRGMVLSWLAGPLTLLFAGLRGLIFLLAFTARSVVALSLAFAGFGMAGVWRILPFTIFNALLLPFRIVNGLVFGILRTLLLVGSILGFVGTVITYAVGGPLYGIFLLITRMPSILRGLIWLLFAAGRALVFIGGGFVFALYRSLPGLLTALWTTIISGVTTMATALGAILTLTVPLSVVSGAITALVFALGGLFLYSNREAIFGPLIRGFQDMAEVIKSTWHGVINAIKANDLTLAMEIVTTSIELLWNQLMISMTQAWEGFVNAFRTSPHTAWMVDLWDIAAGGGRVRNAVRARDEAINAAARPMLERGESMQRAFREVNPALAAHMAGGGTLATVSEPIQDILRRQAEMGNVGVIQSTIRRFQDIYDAVRAEERRHDALRNAGNMEPLRMELPEWWYRLAGNACGNEQPQWIQDLLRTATRQELINREGSRAGNIIDLQERLRDLTTRAERSATLAGFPEGARRLFAQLPLMGGTPGAGMSSFALMARMGLLDLQRPADAIRRRAPGEGAGEFGELQSEKQFKVVSLRRFMLEGPGGLATVARHRQPVEDHGTHQRLDRIIGAGQSGRNFIRR